MVDAFGFWLGLFSLCGMIGILGWGVGYIHGVQTMADNRIRLLEKEEATRQAEARLRSLVAEEVAKKA